MKKKPTLWLFIFLFVSIGIFYIIQDIFDLSYTSEVDGLREKFDSFGIWAPIVYIMLTAIGVIIVPIPAIPLYIVSVVIWGPFIATIFTIIGNEVGAIVSFLIGRKIGKEFLEKTFKREITICEDCSEKQIGIVLLIARFFPIFHFDLISYAAGLTKISLKTFSIVTLIGITPKIILIMYFGSSFQTGNYVITILLLVLLTAMFVIPILFNKYNIFGMKQISKRLKMKKK